MIYFSRHGSHSRYNRGCEGADRVGKCFQEWSQAGRPSTTGMIVHVHFVYVSCCQDTVGIVCGALVQTAITINKDMNGEKELEYSLAGCYHE